MKTAPTEYSSLLESVSAFIGPNRAPTIIGFDGEGGAGKTSAALWLAWQLGIPALHLDLFTRTPTEKATPINWRFDDLNRCVASRGNDRCLIIEGVLLLDALTEVQGRKLGYLVFVENIRPPTAHVRPRTDSELKDAREFSLTNQVARYFGRAKPKERANFVLSWQEPTP
jgi:hypothetical protein